ISKRGDHNLAVLARLKPNVSLQQAQSEMTSVAKALEQEHPESNAFYTVTVLPLREQIVGDIRPSLLVLMAAVALVLLIACSNVANMLLARATGRQREIAIRTALGASRSRIIRQLLTEAILLSLLGGAVGILLNLVGIKLLLALLPESVLRIDEIPTDAAVLGFTLVLSFLTGAFFGLAPSLKITKVDTNEMLKEGGSKGSTGGFRRNRTRSILVISEVAFSLMLLIGAGLLIKSYMSLLYVNPGLNPENVLTARVPLAQTKYAESYQKKAFFTRALQELKASPGVVAVGATSHVPLSGQEASRGFSIEGKQVSSPQETPLGDNRTIDAEYFRVMEIPLLKGRLFTAADNESAPGVVIINDSMARRFFSGEDPLGKRLKMGGPTSTRPWLTVIGVVGDVRHTGLKAEVRPSMYVPYAQSIEPDMTLVVRTASDPMAAAATVRRIIWSIDKDQPLTDIKTMEQYFSDSVALQRFNMLLLGVFAIVALILAALGVYGVMSYSVSQRTREIGIRMALGAQAKDVLKLILKQGMFLAVLGVAIGLTAAFILTRVMQSLLFDVATNDVVIFIGAALVLILVMLIASYVPARRAIRIEPTIALRDD
ncbi:MAG TPA: ABC transporter permease, partial [Pyrinomonadaceae bacterium]|nr:ABC transporter permease [Pyrinomonadaceae bacterium]